MAYPVSRGIRGRRRSTRRPASPSRRSRGCRRVRIVSDGRAGLSWTAGAAGRAAVSRTARTAYTGPALSGTAGTGRDARPAIYPGQPATSLIGRPDPIQGSPDRSQGNPECRAYPYSTVPGAQGTGGTPFPQPGYTAGYQRRPNCTERRPADDSRPADTAAARWRARPGQPAAAADGADDWRRHCRSGQHCRRRRHQVV